MIRWRARWYWYAVALGLPFAVLLVTVGFNVVALGASVLSLGLLIPRTRRLAGICLVVLLVALFPANVNAIINGIPLGGNAPTPLWVRGPMQLLYIGMVWWTSIKERPKEVGRPQVEERVAEYEQPSRQGAAS
jgi:uncharacterized membrane protein